MVRDNTTEMAVMGLLALGARTGYDVRQECEQKLSHFWSESFGQIYPVLRALHERGWVSREPAAGPGPTKYEHALTEEGRAALRQWIASPPQPMRVRNELLLKLFLGRMVDGEQLVELLRRHIARTRTVRGQLFAIKEKIETEYAEHPDARFWLVTIDYGVRSLEAQREWAEAAIDALSEDRERGGAP